MPPIPKPSFPIESSSRITLKDIAKIAGVTITSVSYALHGNGRISRQQKERIQKIAVKYGYQPKLAAQLLRGKSTRQIGLLLPGDNPSEVLKGGYASHILGYFIKQCEQRHLGYHIEFYDNSRTKGTLQIPKQIAGGFVDGTLLCGFVNAQLRQWLSNQKQYPWVSIDEPSDLCVLSATNDGVFNGIQYLAALGHKRIGLVLGPTQYTIHRLGMEGFKRAVETFSLATQSSWQCSFSKTKRAAEFRKVAEWSSRLLSAKNRPTAILSCDSDMGRILLFEAIRLGLQVPRDLSILTVGIGYDAESTIPQFSSIEMDTESMVIQALDLMAWRLRDPQLQNQTRMVNPKLVLRGTTAAPTF